MGDDGRPIPQQDRSAQRVAAMLDAAASLIDEQGLDAVTATSVGHLSGSSVGSVYRYFPSMTVLLRTLANRNLERFLERVEAGSEAASDTPWSSLNNTLDVFEDMYRTEPSFRRLRFGDAVAADFLTSTEHNMVTIARALAGMLSDTHAIPIDDRMLHHLEVAVTSHSALVELAFAKDADGDRRLLEEAKRLTLRYLPEHLPIASDEEGGDRPT